jgi:hypothetical protein
MNNFSSLFTKENTGELILAVLLIIYLIMGKKPPAPVAQFTNSMIGKILLLLIVIYMFIHSNPILAVLILFVVFDLIRRSGNLFNNTYSKKFIPSETKKTSQLTAFNQYQYTLEQEVVKKMAPLVNNSYPVNKPTYKPIVNNLYDASPIDSSN